MIEILRPFFDVTPEPWLVDAAVIAAGLGAIGWLWKKLVWPLLSGAGRALVLAVKAAPQIRDGVDELQALIRGDVLEQLRRTHDVANDHEARIAENTAAIASHEGTLGEHSARLQEHQDGLADLRSRVRTLEGPQIGGGEDTPPEPFILRP